MVLLDLKKAFDVADHNGLLKKLSIYLKDSCLEHLGGGDSSVVRAPDS